MKKISCVKLTPSLTLGLDNQEKQGYQTQKYFHHCTSLPDMKMTQMTQIQELIFVLYALH